MQEYTNIARKENYMDKLMIEEVDDQKSSLVYHEPTKHKI